MPLITSNPFKTVIAPSQVSLFQYTAVNSNTVHQVNVPDVSDGTFHVAFINVWNTSGGYGGITLPLGSHEHDAVNGRIALSLGGGIYIGSFAITHVSVAPEAPTIQFLTANPSNSLTLVVTMSTHSVAHTLGVPTLGQIKYSKFGLTSSEPLVTLPGVTTTVGSETIRNAWKYNNTSANTGYPPVGHEAIVDSVVQPGGSYWASRLQDVSAGTKGQVTFTTDTNAVNTGLTVAVPR